MSAYEGDPRVQFNDDGTATLPVGTDDYWYIQEKDHVWTADSPVQGFLRSRYNGDFRATFRSRDEAIEALIGAPQVAVE